MNRKSTIKEILCSTLVKSNKRHHFGLSVKIWKTLSKNMYFIGPQITINIGGSSNVGLNALHKKHNCFFPLFFFYPQAVIFLTLPSSYFPSSNNVGYVYIEFLIQTVESKYFLDCVCNIRKEKFNESKFLCRES